MVKVLKSKWFLGLMVLVIGWLGVSFIKIKLHDDIVNKEVVELEMRIGNLEKSNNILGKFIAYMSNPSFLERQARIKLNYKAPGEEVVFVYPDESAKAASSSGNFKEKRAPNYVKWIYYILEK